MNDDRDLLAALRRRDAQAFATLFDRYSDKIYRLAVGLLQDEMEAESVVQDAFLRLFEHLDSFEGRARVGTWLYRVAYNLAVDALRRRRPLLALADEPEDDAVPAPAVLADWRQWPEGVLTQAEIAAELDAAIAALPEKYRAVFLLREVEGLSTDETAEVIGLSRSAAKVRLHRARLFLREQLASSLTERV